MAQKMEAWIKDSLSKLLSLDIPNEMVDFIMLIDNNEELNQYLSTLLNPQNPAHKMFADKLLKNKERVFCNCESKYHALVNNCLNCGRIICEQEGSGPCYFCGGLVCSPEDIEIMTDRNQEKVNAYRKRLEQLQRPNYVQVPVVRDVAMDQLRQSLQQFGVTHNWAITDTDRDMSLLKYYKEKEAERVRKEELKKEEKNRNAHSVIDFYGWKDPKGNEKIFKDKIDYLEEKIDRELFDRELYVEYYRDSDLSNYNPHVMRVQDKGIQMMSDTGKCLALVQPTASLLVRGVQRCIVTSWYTPIRGRLWIASSSRFEESLIGESSTSQHCTDEQRQDYPVNVLLGHVTLEECISHTPGNYYLDFSHPRVLPQAIPMNSQSEKIFMLEQAVHTKARMVDNVFSHKYDD